MSLDEKPELLDLNGSEPILEYNPTKNVLVYAVGCMLVYWELSTDKKLYLKYHEGNIGCVKFSKCGNFLITVDKLSSPHVVIWNIPTLTVHFQSHIPIGLNSVTEDQKKVNYQANNNNYVQDIFISFLNESHFILILNVDEKQKIFYFEFKKQVNLIFDSTLEIDNYCLGVDSFDNGKSFATQEAKTIKIWKIDNLKITLTTKIHVKSKLLERSLNICRYLKLIIVISDCGSAFILDENGKFLVFLSRSNEGEDFTSAMIINENLYLGGDKGSVFLYNLNGFNLMNVVTYDSSIKMKYLNNKTENNAKDVLKNMNSVSNITSMNIYSNCELDLIKSLGINSNRSHQSTYEKDLKCQKKSKTTNGPSITNMCVSGKLYSLKL